MASEGLYNYLTNTTTTILSSPEDITMANHTSLDEEEDYYQAETLALILPRITAIISLFAVVCVALEAYSDILATRQGSSVVTTRSNRVRASTNNSTSTITRIQLFYQIPLFCHALAFALGTTPAPSELDVWGAAGNTATCEAQGFLLQFGIFGNIGWDVALSTAYLLMVRYNMPSARLLSLEKYYHLIIWPIVLLLCIYPLIMDMYNMNHSVCWLESYPNDCVGDECERGAGASLMQTIASGFGVLHLLYSIAVMMSIYCGIRGLEDRNRRYGSRSFGEENNPTPTNRRYSRAVAVQGMLYAGGMILTTLPTAAYIIVYNLTGLWSPGFGIFATSLTPLMGYVNFVIFIRGRSVEDCQTQYGKLMRRLHSCLFDYKLICECKCRCVPRHEEVDDVESPKKKKRDRQDAPTAPTAPTAAPTTLRGSKAKKSADAQESAPQQQQQHQEAEDTHSATEEEGRLTGTWIHPQKSKASLVSELEGSEFEFCDMSPVKPVRIRSQVEQPPVQPRRVVSELGNLDEDEDDDSFIDESKGQAPPAKPVRLVSEAPMATASEFSCSSTSIAGAPMAADLEAPPVPPQRYVSELDISASTHCHQDSVVVAAPSIEPRDDSLLHNSATSRAPPIQPMRFESEVTPSHMDTSVSEVSFAAETFVEEAAQAPPAMPIRFVSEAPEEEQG